MHDRGERVLETERHEACCVHSGSMLLQLNWTEKAVNEYSEFKVVKLAARSKRVVLESSVASAARLGFAVLDSRKDYGGKAKMYIATGILAPSCGWLDLVILKRRLS